MRRASLYIRQSLPEIPFCSIRKLANLAGVSPLTIIRLTRVWGFDGYPDFQAAVRDSLFRQPSDPGGAGPDAGGAQPSAQIREAADMINRARAVHITGARSARAFATYMHYMGRMVYDHFHLMSPSGAVTAEDLALLTGDDMLIAFSTYPYSTETVRLVEAAYSLNIPALAITDDISSPLARHASLSVTVPIIKQDRLFRMAPIITAIEQILEESFNSPSANADQRISYFANRVKAIKGYW